MGNLEIPNWLEGLPLAPEFRPTDTEFADPIAYISKIEKEAGAFGICKVIPPLPKPSKKYVFSNLNKSLSKCPELGSHGNLSSERNSASKTGSADGGNDGEVRAVFTTRQQELGQNVKKSKGAVQSPPSGVYKQVWQSGEIYTLEQFEAKSKAFTKSQLGMVKEASPLVVEAMFWKAALEKPIYLEYANDVPGSGFGEPEGQFRHFHRRRRKRNFFRRNGESSSCKTNEIVSDRIDVLQNDYGKDTYPKIHSDVCLDVPKTPTCPPILPANEASQLFKRKGHNSCYDKEGTAGWKISNSPWNLQVISRSPGSLTRFMPDDIPGVTSPMVYIGMLFSWFAWHVEDHELHSMNFLHTGSSKTWYSVPGDYAFAFEEVVRSQAYGGNIDRIAALALLGEKTTLMSPEVVVASGIPCCRLVQNPGEFVVTFPRAYHVGFSHGFNCGEAANFGTPQWLKVAKEAAVRRAAMNYLPMLSHQQLLYLLTMSFVSRVPRSLLPGVRSSRLRDRQKEERELLVKKAFIEDILQDNSTLSVLLGKDSSYRAVLWNPDLLTYPSKESLSAGASVTVGTIPTEKPSHFYPIEHNNDNSNLIDEMSLYMENLDDLYLGSDDLSCDFQVDSGTLACVACGILGFPFMSVVQPSEKASLELIHHDHLLVEERHGVSGYSKSSSSRNFDSTSIGSLKENLPPIASDSACEADLPITSNDCWNAHNKFLRPRSFCLEHAVEIVELLQCKGGANVLVICHSDYQKIKAHATTIAEEIGSRFNYKEVPLDTASKDDLNLIDLAIDNDERNKFGEDWTSRLGINLRHCVKIRKNSPSKQVQHALTLGGLFSNKCQASDFSSIKWQFRRSRSKKIYFPADFKLGSSAASKNDVVTEESSLTIKKEVKLIQYSRRNFKRKPGGSAGAGNGCGSHVTVKDHEQRRMESEKDNRYGGDSNGSGFSPSNRMSRMQSDIQIPELKRDESVETGRGTAETQIETRTLEDMNVDSEAHNLAALDDSMVQVEANVEAKTASYTDEGNGKSLEVHEEQVGGQFNRTNEASTLASEVHSSVEADEDVLASSLATSSEEVQTSFAVVENDCTNGQVCDLVAVDDEVVSGVHATETNNRKPISCNSMTGGNNERPVSCSSTLKDHIDASTDEFFEGPRETCSVECSSNDKPLLVNPEQIITENSSDGKNLEIKPHEAITRINEYPPASIEETYEVPMETHSTENLSNRISVGAEGEQETDKITKETVAASIEAASESPSDLCAASEKCDGLTLEKEMQHGRTKELASSSATHVECSTVPRGKSPEEDLGNDVISEHETLMRSREQGSYSIVVRLTGKQPDHDGESEVPDSAEDHSVDCLTSNNNTERKCQDNREASLRTETMFQKYTRAKRHNGHPTENLSNDTEVCSLQVDIELDNTKSDDINGVSNAKKSGKRKREIKLLTENKFICGGYIRSPCEGLRPRAGKDATATSSGTNIDVQVKEKPRAKSKKPSSTRAPPKDNKKQNSGKSHKCDIEGCRMSFNTKVELNLHKRNRCPHEGCGKRFSSHKYAMIHHRVHDDDRPLKCPWKGCSVSFKWAWARTEHIRVHTGERPYKCKIEGCALSFRFVSDFSRHRRKTGHYVNQPVP